MFLLGKMITFLLPGRGRISLNGVTESVLFLLYDGLALILQAVVQFFQDAAALRKIWSASVREGEVVHSEPTLRINL